MKDPASMGKAQADWDAAQERAYRRFYFDHSRRAYIAVEAARITRTIDELERAELFDLQCDVPAGPHNAPGVGRWPYA